MFVVLMATSDQDILSTRESWRLLKPADLLIVLGLRYGV